MVSNGVNIPLVELINAGIEINGERLSAGITFNVTRGEFVCLHGPTGSGKSLALSMIAGILRPTFGEVRVAGDCLNNFTEREMAIVRRSMGIMMQECLLLDNRTILENVNAAVARCRRVLRQGARGRHERTRQVRHRGSGSGPSARSVSRTKADRKRGARHR